MSKQQRRKAKYILWIGWGDVTRKSAVAITALQVLGYTILGLDVSDGPSGLIAVAPDELFVYNNSKHHSKLLKIGQAHGFDLMYVANPGNFHVASAIEFQNYAERIVIAKPFDTNIDFLKNIQANEDTFCHLLAKVSVHDHYTNKPGIEFLAKIMRKLHERHNLIRNIKMFLIERSSILGPEKHRLEGLKCGALFDLAVHLVSVLFEIVPQSVSWSNSQGTFERRGHRVIPVACSTGLDGGASVYMRGENTAIHGRDAETFAVVELRIEESMAHNGVAANHPSLFPVLIAVGKGVAISPQATRDLKAIEIEFMDGAKVRLDMDTYQFAGVDDSILDDQSYEDLDVKQRGLNAPIIYAAERKFADAPDEPPFQNWGAALRAADALFHAQHMAPLDTLGYNENSINCKSLITELMSRPGSHFSLWNLEENFNNYLIGKPDPVSVF